MGLRERIRERLSISAIRRRPFVSAVWIALLSLIFPSISLFVLGLSAEPAFAYACNGQRSCTNPATGCSHTFVEVANTWAPGRGSVILYFSNYCATIWGGTYPANPFNGGTLDARVNGAGEDTLGLPLYYDSYLGMNDTAQLNDINVCGYAMGYGTDNQWHATSCY